MSYFYVEYFVSHSTEKFQEGTLRAVVQRTSGFEKVRKKGGNEGVSRFSDESFFFSVPKVLVEVPFNISPVSGIENG